MTVRNKLAVTKLVFHLYHDVVKFIHVEPEIFLELKGTIPSSAERTVMTSLWLSVVLNEHDIEQVVR